MPIFKKLISLIWILYLSGVVADKASASIRVSQDPLKSVRISRSIGRLYMAYGQYDKAEQFIRDAVEKVGTLQEADNEKAICLIDLATLYSYQERLAESEAMFLRGLEAQKEVLGQDHPYVSHTLRNLSAVYLKQGRFDKATETLEQAFAIILSHHLPENRILTPFYIDQATLLCKQGYYEEAEIIFSEMLDRVGLEFGFEHLYYSEVQKGLATVYLNTGRYEQADQLLKNSLQIQETIFGQSHQQLIGSYLLAAQVCRGRHDEQGMQQYFDKAVAAVNRTGDLVAAANLYVKIDQIRRTETLVAVTVQTLPDAPAG